MKKIILLILLIFLPLGVRAANQNRSSGLRVTPRNIEELNKSIERRKENFKKERLEMSELRGKIYENQNKLRSGAQNIMIMENMIGERGQEAAIIAENLNNSVKKTLEFEENFAERSGFMKFLFGYKKDIKEKFANEINYREGEILKLEEIIKSVDIDKDIYTVIREQFDDIRNEQDRIKNYYNKESGKNGILGWILNIFD